MPPELASPRPTSLDAERAVKALLAEWLAGWFDGTTKALGLEAAVLWPALPADRIVFDAGPQPDGGALVMRLLLVEQSNRAGKRGGLAGQTEGNLHFADYLCHCWVSADTVTGPASGAEVVATAANLLRALAENGDSRFQLEDRGVRVVAVTNVGAIQQEAGGPLHLVRLQLRAIYRAKFADS